MRRMSFAMTERQLLDGSKTVTRRLGWIGLKPGVTLLAVDKCMGLKRGEKSRELCQILVTAVRREPLHYAACSGEPAREGFPELTGREFIDLFCRAQKCDVWAEVTRIEFERV